MRTAAYGSWDSPLSSERLAQGNVRLGFPSFGRDGSLFFCELRSNEQGRTALVRCRPDGTFEESGS